VSMSLRNFLKYSFGQPSSWGIESDIHVDLGCGTNPRNPFRSQKIIGLDVISDLDFSEFGIEYTHLVDATRFPFSSNSIDSISGFDFIEHLSRSYRSDLGTNEFIHYMNEVSRVLRPGGVALFVTPAFPGIMAFSDPTHQNFITRETVNYFVSSEKNLCAPATEMQYGFNGNLTLLSQFWVYPPQLVFNSRVIHDDQNSEINRFLLFKFYLKNLFTSPFSFIKGFTRPSHLAWVLRKPQ